MIRKVFQVNPTYLLALFMALNGKGDGSGVPIAL
jgi:hypothetical protein